MTMWDLLFSRALILRIHPRISTTQILNLLQGSRMNFLLNTRKQPVEPGEISGPTEPEEPEVQTGSFVTKWGSTYYVLEDGTKLTGLNTIEGYTYYFKTNNGAMTKNSYVTIDDDIYYFDSEGHMVTGFMSKWLSTYYFDENGHQQFETLISVDGYTYYVNEKGAVVKSSFVDLEDGTHYFDSEGHMVVSATITRWFKHYTFDENGVLIH